MNTPEQIFLQVVEAGSFRKAATHLNLEPSSVSRKVAALEQRLKVKLLHRSTARIQTTELGQEYYVRLRKIIDAQMALEEDITSGVNDLQGTLRVSTTTDFAEEFIVPVMLKMQQQSPALRIELILGSDVDNLAEKNLDVAIRFGPLPDSRLIAKPLGHIPRMLVASPGYLAEYGTPNTLDDLAQHQFILYAATQAKYDIQFTDGALLPHSQIQHHLTINSIRAIRSLVLADKGIHLGPVWLYKDDLDQGRVISVLPQHIPTSFHLHAVYAARSFLPQKTKTFIQQVSTQIALSNQLNRTL